MDIGKVIRRVTKLPRPTPIPVKLPKPVPVPAPVPAPVAPVIPDRDKKGGTR
jgi:hypothetical protein